MALIRPFRALRPVPEKASQVAAVPYDVVNREEARALAEGIPWSFLRVSRAEIGLGAEVDPYSPEVYQAARNSLDRMIRECPMIREPEPSIYLYRLRMGGHSQVGIAAGFSIDEYDQGRIKKHERTRPDKEDDRTRHILSIQAQTGPVFLTYRGSELIDELVEAETRTAPIYDFTAPDGVAHTLWKARNAALFAERFTGISALYIADGHHRAASASRARAQLRSSNPGHSPGQSPGQPPGQPEDADYNFFLAVAFPAAQLRILPYNRVLKDLNGRKPDELLRAIEDAGFRINPGSAAEPRHGEFGMYLNRKWWLISPVDRAHPSTSRNPIDKLDVSILQSRILDPLFGVRDPRTDKRIDFVGGIRGTAELERLVDRGQAAVAFSLHPTTVDDLMEISDAGEIMPPKSTWFEPKLRDGLLNHLIG